MSRTKPFIITSSAFPRALSLFLLSSLSALVFFSNSVSNGKMTSLFVSAVQTDEDNPDARQRFAMTMSLNTTRERVKRALVEEVRKIANEQSFNARLIETRRALHLIPEVMWTETETSKFVKEELDSLGIEYEDAAKPGILARLPLERENIRQCGSEEGKIAVLLRADIDGLPVQEETGFSFASKNKGRMHACGHDGHVTMLLGAARLIVEMLRSGKIPEDVKRNAVVYFAFQPAEEGGAGAKRMLESTSMRKILPKPSTSFALHNWPYPETPSGTFGTRAGTIMAGAGTFEITVKGKGGHAAVPHKNIDVIVCGSKIVTDVQTIVSRKASALDSVVVTISTFHAGTVANVMPDEAKLTGTLRSLQPEAFAWAIDELEKVVTAVGKANGCTVDVSFASHEVYPPTVNDKRAAEFAKAVARGIFGENEDVVLDVSPVMPAEDFSFFANEYPSVMSWIGSYNEEIGATFPLHSSKYNLDESILKNGAAVHAGYALAFWLVMRLSVRC